MLTSFEQVLNKAREADHPKKIAVADAASTETLRALAQAEDIVSPVLVGDKEKILPIIEETGLSRYELVDERTQQNSSSLCLSCPS